MRRFLLTALVSLYVFVGFAQLNGDGYYRFQNVGSERYLYVYDNRGSISIGTTSADLGAIQLWSDFNKRSEERRVGKECRSRWSPYH